MGQNEPMMKANLSGIVLNNQSMRQSIHRIRRRTPSVFIAMVSISFMLTVYSFFLFRKLSWINFTRKYFKAIFLEASKMSQNECFACMAYGV